MKDITVNGKWTFECKVCHETFGEEEERKPHTCVTCSEK